MVKLISLLVVLVGLAILVLQNAAPIAIVFLGSPTPALPLGLWVLGALIAGALTTLLIAGLLNLAYPAAKRPGRSAARSPNSASNPSGNASARAAGWTPVDPAARSEDGWSERRNPDDWDDWEESAPRRSPPPRSTPRRDREEVTWKDWQSYEAEDRSPNPSPDPSTRFEKPQPPPATERSGTVYSQRYQPSETPSPKPGVYDAEFRVIMPPYADTPNDTPPPPVNDDDEDWDIENPPRPGDR